MFSFNEISNIILEEKEVKKIDINDATVWEKFNISLTASNNSVYWGQDVTLTASVYPIIEGLELIFSDGKTATTDNNGIATITVNSSTPQTINYTASIYNINSNSCNITWNKRNLKITPMHTGTLYYGHYLRYKITDSVSGSIVTGLSGYINYGAGSNYNVTVNSSGYCQLQLNLGTKTSTTSTSYSGKCKITGNSLYNTSSEYSASYSYVPSKKYNASLSAASTGTGCTATTSGKYYGRWYPTGDYTLVEALKGSGTVRAYLASSSGSSACKTPEELYVKTNGKSGTSTVSGTVLAIGYYITGRRNKTVTVKFNNILIQQYSNSAWSTKATASRTTTLPYDEDATYGEYTGTFSFVPTMSQLTSGYIRLVADFAANTQSDLGYVYVSEFYPQVWYSPTQTFKS